MYLGTMNPKDWLLTASAIAVIGFEKDSNIELEMREDAVDVDSGIQGDWSFVEKNDESSTVKFTLQRPSATNAALHALFKAKTVFAVTLTNIRNGTVHSLPYCRIQKQPKDGVTNGSNAQTLDWVFIAGETDSTIL